ncbi:SMP-30/gluconolactonase/LRE family protein [Chitinophaga lutea]
MKRLAQLQYYTEGPAADEQGNVYFTTLSGGVIWKVDPAGSLSEWARSECPNGQIILPGGDHLVCDSRTGAIRRFSATGVFMRDETIGIDTPNDIVADRSGRLFFSGSVRHTGKVFCLDADGKRREICGGLDYPNGLALSPDGRWLYVAESYRNRILAIPTDMPEEGFREVATLPEHISGRPENNLPDGLAVDTEGNIWIAHYGMAAVQVIGADGEWKRAIAMPMPLVSNLTWTQDGLIVTGGFGEPGPGVVYKITC